MPTTRPPSCCMASTKTDELAPRALALVAPAEVGCALPDSDELVTVTRELSLPELEPDLAALGRALERELFLDLRWGGSALEAEAEARAEVRATPSWRGKKLEAEAPLGAAVGTTATCGTGAAGAWWPAYGRAAAR